MFMSPKGLPALSLAAVFSALAGSIVLADDEPLQACFEAVGTYLTTNTASIDGERGMVGRSLLSLTNGGHAFLTDSNEAGIVGFAPFTDGRGAWRCTSDERGRLHLLIIILDFTLATPDHPEQQIARLDYDATYHSRTETLRADAALSFVPIDADPLDEDALEEPFNFTLRGTRIMPR